jgi:hypothetical protein
MFLALLGAAPAVAQDAGATDRELQLAFDAMGHVTLVARNVTVREILAEWSRQGGSHFVNLERLAGAPLAVPVRFENRPEVEVIESLLRTAAGIIVSPRTVDNPGVSRVAAVYIVPTSNPTSTPASSFPGTSAAAPVAVPIAAGAPDDELPPVTPPIAPVMPAEQEAPAPPPQQPSPFMGGPGGVFGSRPGTPWPQPGAPTPAPAPGGRAQPVPVVPVPR